jgi:hypothetical protein
MARQRQDVVRILRPAASPLVLFTMISMDCSTRCFSDFPAKKGGFVGALGDPEASIWSNPVIR